MPHAPEKELVSGESALYLGRTYRTELVDAGSPAVRFGNRFYIPRARADQRKQMLREW